MLKSIVRNEFIYKISFVMLLVATACQQNSPQIPGAADTKQVADQAAACPAAIGDAGLAAVAPSAVSHDTVVLDSGVKLNYTLTAGYLPVYAQGQQTGRVRACLFYWSYTRDDQANNSKWPVSFLFNGGPTSSSTWIQFGGMAPKKLDLGTEGITVPSTQNLVGDKYTLLADSDLIFIDPVNSGLSRPANGVAASDFNGLNQDADSIGDAIQTYLTTYNRTGSPKYIVGESYAGMRTPVLSRYLDEKLHIKLAGITLISPWLDAVGDAFGDELGNDLPYVLAIPQQAASAWYHKKLSPDLQALNLEQVYKQAQSFAYDSYAPALMAGDALSAQSRAAMAAQLSRLTSLSADYILSKNLRVDSSMYVGQLLKDQGLTVSYYDGRMASVIKDPNTQDPTDLFNPFFTSAVKESLTNLKESPDVNFLDIYSPPAWPGANPGGNIEGSYLNVLGDITALLKNNPSLNLNLASGYYDSVCSAAEMEYMVNRLDASLIPRIAIFRYPGGHPVYFGDVAHKQFASDLHDYYAKTNPVLTIQP